MCVVVCLEVGRRPKLATKQVTLYNHFIAHRDVAFTRAHFLASFNVSHHFQCATPTASVHQPRYCCSGWRNDGRKPVFSSAARSATQACGPKL